MDVTGASTANGAKVQIYDCNGTAAQQWTATGGTLVNTGSGKCLDATGQSSANGNQLQIWSCSGAANQKWTLPGATTPPTTTPATTAPAGDTALPVRAAFYYPWYPENFTSPGTKYTPSAGFYNGDDPAVIDRQIGDMQYAGLQSGIASWWGQGTREDRRLGLLMTEATKLHFSWTAYYENEGFGDPTVAQISADLAYLKKYSDTATWLHIGGKPVIFAYGDGNDGCSMVTRWKQANTYGYYVVLKVFGGYRTCADQPQGWHQYAPGGNIDIQSGYAVSVSPGFFRYDATTPLLARDINRFRTDVTTMAQSKAPFQLITTFNEWGEGTSVESTTAWPSADGHGQYIDVLHDVFAANPR
jgi:hypothetical protein